MDDYDGPIYHGVEVDDNFEGAIYHVKLVGGGSGDQHNLGYYATQAALEEAHPTATAGDWAIVGSTDTVWIWDTDNTEWTDSGAKSTTYTAGTGISITNNEISVTDPVVLNPARNSVKIASTYNITDTAQIIIGTSANATGSGSISIGRYEKSYNGSVQIGNMTTVGTKSIGILGSTEANYAIQFGGGVNGLAKNSDANTFKVANANGNFEIMSADGTVPTARLTKVNTTITLTAAGWSNGSQTVSVSGITSTGVVFVSPDPTDQADYVAAGILCTSQATDSLTFTCDTTPSSDIDVVVVQM